MKYLAIDLGSKRIGLATSDNKGIVAQPFTVLSPTSDNDALQTISNVCTEQHIDAIVLGIPFSASEKTQKKYRTFGEKIHSTTGLTVHEWDETFTTKQAQNMVAFSDRPDRKKSSSHRDSIAAAIILQEYLDNGS